MLQRRIDQLQQEIELFASFPLPTQSEKPDARGQELAKLRDELERELKTKRVVILGTEHGCRSISLLHRQ
jgi:hypothetical protein